jgi:hypothetical protein
MTIALGSRNLDATIDVLDATGSTTATVNVGDELVDLVLSTNLLDTSAPDGRISWSGTATFTYVTDTAISLDSRSTAGSPSGAQIWARGNRLNLSIADSGGTLRSFPCALYISSIPNPPNPPNNTISIELADLLEADNFPQVEGDKAGVTEGTSTDRKAIIDTILADVGLPAVAGADTLSVYPLTKSPQKTDVLAWVNFCGKLAASAGYLFWISSTNTRLTPINFNQAAPKFSLTIGEDEASFEFTNQSERPPETLIVTGTGYNTEEGVFPRTSETWFYTTKGALVNSGDTDVVVGRYESVTESLIGNTLTITKLVQVPRIVINPSSSSFSYSLRTAIRSVETRRYSSVTGSLSSVSISEEWAKGWINKVVGSEEFSTDLLNTINYRTTKINFQYSGVTGLLTDVTTTVDSIRASLGANLTPATTEFRSAEIIEKWRKKGRDVWRYDRLESRSAQEIYNGEIGDMSPYALVPDEQRSQSFQTNTGEANPPQTERKPESINSDLVQYSGLANFTPISGTEAKQTKTDTVELPGGFCSSDAQCTEIANLLGKIRHGRSLAAQYTGPIPDWFLTSYEPLPRVDVTLGGITTAYLADGISIALDGTEAAFSAYLIEIGTVGATAAAVSPRYQAKSLITAGLVFTPTVAPLIELGGDEITAEIVFSPTIGILGSVAAAATLGSITASGSVLVRGTVTSDATLGAITPSATASAKFVSTNITLGAITAAASMDTDDVDPDYASVALLLHCDGANGSTSFTDNSLNALTITANGNAQVTTTDPKFGTGALTLDGSGDWLEVPADVDFEFGTGLFTVDLWLKTSQGTGFHQPIGQFYASPLNGEWSLRPKNQGGSGGGIGIAYRTAIGFVDANSGFDVNDDSWHFIRIVRESPTSLKIYVDGTQRLSHTISASQTLGRTGRGLRLGRNENDSNAYYNGQIDDVRITKGVARSGAEVPTLPFPNA